MRIYVISLLAFSRLEDGTPGGGTYAEQIPCLAPAESIDDAAEQVRKYALDRWKINEGWYAHQADIQPVTSAFYKAAFEAHREGIIDLDEREESRTFKF